MAIHKLNKDDYPEIDKQDIGKYPNIGYGTIDGVVCHCVVGGITTFLTNDITASATSFDVDNASDFPATPFTIQVQQERMRVTSITGNTLTVTRGYDNTLAEAHTKDKGVFEVRTEYVYLVANHPVKAINAVYIDEQKQDLINDTRITAYTGQTGDEHTDFAGKAVIAFSADAYVAPQYNVENASTKESGTSVVAVVDKGSDFKLFDGTTEALTIGEGTQPQKAWVMFADGNGAIIKQRYTISIQNNGTSTAVGYASVTNQSGVAYTTQSYSINAGESKTINLSINNGIWADVLAITCGVGSIEISNMAKTVTIRTERNTDRDDTKKATIQATNIIESYANNSHIAWCIYANDNLGDIVSQTHTVNLDVSTAGIFRLAAVDKTTNICKGYLDFVLSIGTHTLVLKHTGGDWETMTKLVNVTENSTVTDMSKSVEYSTPITRSAKSYVASSTARIVVGNEITVDADWALDTTGDYGGLNLLIERPDWVTKHFLVTQMGYSLTEIDATSFANAGSFYNTNNYKYALIWNNEPISEFAFQARSTLVYFNGKWYLDVIPDTAPTPVKTIVNTELAGSNAMFKFSKMSIVDIKNDITVLYKYNYSKKNWIESIRVVDNSSITKYGTWYGEYKLPFVRDNSMAQNVANNILLRLKVPLKTVTFSVFWDYFDLRVGDTIKITNPLYNNSIYFIEEINKTKSTMSIKAVEWW